MLPLSREWDLTGLNVTWLHIDSRFTVDMWSAERSLSIVFNTQLVFRRPGADDATFDPEQTVTLGPLLSLLHRPVTTFTASPEGRCMLRFADGAELHSEPHPQYEAWEAHGTGQLASVSMFCMPGGGSPWG